MLLHDILYTLVFVYLHYLFNLCMDWLHSCIVWFSWWHRNKAYHGIHVTIMNQSNSLSRPCYLYWYNCDVVFKCMTCYYDSERLEDTCCQEVKEWRTNKWKRLCSMSLKCVYYIQVQARIWHWQGGWEHFQAEGRDWKEVLLSYVAAYRSTPHTTKVWQNWCLEGKCGPWIRDMVNDQEVKDHDGEKKGAS